MELFEISLLFQTKIHAFVLMPNHVHMLISTPQEDLGQIMNHWMRSGTHTINRRSGHSGHIFGGRYHWSLIDSPPYYGHAYKYVYRNPVRANLCDSVQDYRYSTFSGIIGDRSLPFPLHFPFHEENHMYIPDDLEEQQGWLNKPFKIEHQNAIQKALKRTLFQPPKRGWKRILEDLKTPLL